MANQKWNKIFDSYESKMSKKITRIQLDFFTLGEGIGPVIHVRRFYKRYLNLKPDGYFIDPADLLYRVNIWNDAGIKFKWRKINKKVYK